MGVPGIAIEVGPHAIQGTRHADNKDAYPGNIARRSIVIENATTAQQTQSTSMTVTRQQMKAGCMQAVHLRQHHHPVFLKTTQQTEPRAADTERN
jgi:hypothetical protein